MRRLAFVVLLSACGAAVALGQNNQFPQTQGQSNQDGGGSAFTQVHPSPNQNFGAGDAGFSQVHPAATQGGGGGQSGGQQNGSPQNGGMQHGSMPNGGMQNGGVQNGGMQNGGQNDGSTDGQSDGSSEMNIDDARMNFGTVVEAYVAKKSSHGYWSYTDKISDKPGKSWRLTDPSVAEGSVKRRSGSRFSGLVKLRDKRGGRSITLKFVVDFSGDKWKVISVTPPAPAQ